MLTTAPKDSHGFGSTFHLWINLGSKKLPDLLKFS